MREKLTLVLYLLFIDVLSYMLVVLPAYSFQVSSSTTGYVRVASQAAQAAMLSAQRSATLAAVAPLVSGASAGSVAVRMVASSVGWPALGIVAGMTLAMLYYDATKVSSLKAAAATPGAWTVAGVTGSLLTVYSDANYHWVLYGDTRISNGCSPTTANQLQAAGFTLYQNVALTLVNGTVTAGPYCALAKLKTASGTQPVQGAATPATSTQIQSYIGGLPANDPNSLESNTVPVGAQIVPTPADSTASNPVPDTGLATTVVPATQVTGTDLVVNPNATAPTGTQTTHTTTQPTTGTSTTTTTTTTNPDGSVTTTSTHTDSDTAVASCASGNHEQRTFGSILSDHMALWQGSGLLSALNLLKTLTWPTAIPSYSLQSNLLGTFTLDFSAWSGMLTALRSVIIAIAGFVAYKIVFVGAR